jgi:hypothetical protein
MLPVTDTASFYRMVQQNNLGSRAEQWGSMASRNQYRLAYEKTSHYLRPDLYCLDWGSGNGHFSYFLNPKRLED